MKILFYDWALHNIGGGQKFNCKIAEHLSRKHDVTIITLFPINKQKLEKYYSVNLSKIKIISLCKKSKIHPSLLKILVSRKISKFSLNYDLFFNADAQETIKPFAKYNIMYCHFFEPRWYRPARNFFDFFKLCMIYVLKIFYGNHSKKYKIFCNSQYTKYWLKKLWNVDAEIIYPPVDIVEQKKFKKENLIISTGRISPDKNYEFVIECFKNIYKNIKEYTLAICGKIDNTIYFQNLKEMSKNYPIKFLTNLTDKKLKEIYAKAKIFVQAKGLNINEKKYPGLLEHFGMTTAEAMSYGCVPVLVNKGGYKEIVENGKSGFLFNNEKEAIRDIKLLINKKKLFKKMSKEAAKMAKKFSLERMQKEIDRGIEKAVLLR